MSAGMLNCSVNFQFICWHLISCATGLNCRLGFIRAQQDVVIWSVHHRGWMWKYLLLAFLRPLSHWKLISKFMYSQLSKEINFEILFRILERSILRNFAEEISLTLMECCDWSIGQCLQTSNEASTTLAFESLFPMWKCLLSKEKNFFLKYYFEINL